MIHGTRDPAGLDEIRTFVRRVQRNMGRVRVEFALLAPGPRSFPKIVQRLRKLGIRKIDIVPFLLFSGSHVRRDIPLMIAKVSRSFPDTRFQLGRHIGPSDAAVRIALSRWKEMRKK